MTTRTEKQKANNTLTAIVIVGLLVCLVGACVFTAVNWLFPSEPNTTAEYIKQYGGSEQVYARLLSMNDCTALQKEFNTADANQNIGYMKAADQRMKEIGCY